MGLNALVRMPAAVRGALAFMTRLPVGGGKESWDAFRRTPAAFPLAGYVVGAVLALPFALALAMPIPAASSAALYLLAIYGLTGVTHADGLADLADAASVHEQIAEENPGAAARDRRRDVLKDSRTGVGGVLAVTVMVVVLALGAVGLASEGVWAAVATVVAAEVGAKAGMGLLACLGSPAHEGLGSQLVGESSSRSLVGVALASLPAVLLGGSGWDTVATLAAVLLAGPVVALGVKRWATARLGGVSGDAFGAANELGRAAAIHVGVIAWTLT